MTTTKLTIKFCLTKSNQYICKVNRGRHGVATCRKSPQLLSPVALYNSCANLVAMNAVFYTCLFGNNNLPEINDKIIYSYLVYKSISEIESVFDYEGNFNQEALMEYFEEYNHLALCEISPYRISKDLSLSINTVKSRLRYLIQFKILDCNNNLCIFPEIKDSAYFKLEMETGLKGNDLVVYSFLLGKAERFHGKITTYNGIQCKELGMSKKNYEKVLCSLSRKKLIYRDKNNALSITKSKRI